MCTVQRSAVLDAPNSDEKFVGLDARNRPRSQPGNQVILEPQQNLAAMTLGPFGRELRKPFPRDRLKAVRNRNFRRTLGLFLVFTRIEFLPQEPLSFGPLLARHGQCHGWERAEGQPVLPVRKSVFQMPKLRAIGIDCTYRPFSSLSL